MNLIKSICIIVVLLGVASTLKHERKSFLDLKESMEMQEEQSKPMESQADPQNWPPIWPHPYQFTATPNTKVAVDATNFYFTVDNPSSDITKALYRYTQTMFPHRVSELVNPTAPVTHCEINVYDSEAELQMGVNETYTLMIKEGDDTVVISALTQFGVYHGLETLSQLIKYNFDSDSYYIEGSNWDILDQPRFPHRELLIDTSRHFQPVDNIKLVIDSLTYTKANVLHWHIVDIQSFPFQMPNFPELSDMGAYSQYERYSVNDVGDVVEYARQRGVRVVPEFDMPAHSTAFCKSQAKICDSDCKSTLNPILDETYAFLDGYIRDVATYFPDNVLHLGGDELPTDCWTKDPSIQAYLTAHNWTISDAFSQFTNKTHAIAKKYGKIPVGWDEVWKQVGTRLDPAAMIQQWEGSSTCGQATAAGHFCIFSQDPVWYLDHLSTTWQDCYQVDICQAAGVSGTVCDGAKQLLIGGGGEMWGETVDASDFFNTIYPKLPAIIERLWSPSSVTDVNAAQSRLASFRCLLNQRGIQAAPVNNKNARSAPSGPGSCYSQ